MSDTYKYRVMCKNCEAHFWVRIPVGMYREKWMDKYKCEKCGIVGESF